MAGTKEGGRKARNTNIARHGEDFYTRIGAKGGANGHTGGFAANPELAKIAGRRGGLVTKDKYKKNLKDESTQESKTVDRQE